MATIDERNIDLLVREAIDVLSEGIGVFDSERRLIFANQATLADFPQFYAALQSGLTWAESAALAIAHAEPSWTPEQVAAEARTTEEHIFSGNPVELETETGGIARIVYRKMASGRFAAVSANITDLRRKETELSIAKERAEAASEAKSRFLANVSHEIRTPLNGIMGMTQVLAASKLAPEQREQIEVILDSGKTLVALLNDVLDLAKIEAGKLEISPIDADISHVLHRLYKLWSPSAEEKGVELSLDIGASLPPRLRFDPVRFRQCISNLISNAIKFTSQGEVNVHVSIPRSGPNAGLVQVKITDTGIGMDADALERLFKPFSQGDTSTTRRFGGTGLGLSITKRLTQLMGGDVTVKSVPDEGSTFVATFAAEPASIAEIPSQIEAGTRRSGRPTDGLKLLVVDDMPINRKIARLFLENQKWAVEEAHDGVEALQRLNQEKFDLVLLDVHMPNMDGPETLRRIRESDAGWRNIPVIALTANAMSGDRERYMHLGMDGYISKPIDQRELFAEINRVWAGAPDNILAKAG